MIHWGQDLYQGQWTLDEVREMYFSKEPLTEAEITYGRELAAKLDAEHDAAVEASIDRIVRENRELLILLAK